MLHGYSGSQSKVESRYYKRCWQSMKFLLFLFTEKYADEMSQSTCYFAVQAHQTIDLRTCWGQHFTPFLHFLTGKWTSLNYESMHNRLFLKCMKFLQMCAFSIIIITYDYDFLMVILCMIFRAILMQQLTVPKKQSYHHITLLFFKHPTLSQERKEKPCEPLFWKQRFVLDQIWE